MTLADRVQAFASAYPRWPASHPRIVQEGGFDVLYATWVLGNDYRTRSAFYGAYPHGYLPRVLALFPECQAPAVPSHVLHVFSGSLPASAAYVRCDLVQPAEVSCSVYDLPAAWPAALERPRLILADPPYSAADATQYGTPMINRGRALRALAQVAAPGAHLAWLDTVWPMHRKVEWRTVGRILIQRSTNHRVRLLSLFERTAG